MFCKNCGKQLEDGTVFCSNCGTKQAEEAAQAPEATQTDNLNTETIDEAVANESIAEQPPKKKKKGLIIGIIAAAIVALCAIAAFAFPYIKNFASKTSGDEKSYHEKVVNEAVENTSGTIGEKIDELKMYFDEDSDSASLFGNSESEFSITVSKEIISLLSEETNIDFSFINDLKLKLGTYTDGEYEKLDLGIYLSNDRLITGNIILNPENNHYYISLPELSDTAIEVDLLELMSMDEESAKEATDMLNDIVDALPEGKTFENILNRYAKIALAELDDVEEDKEELEVGEISVKCTASTVTIDGKTVADILIAVFEEFKDDDEIWDIVEDICKIAAPGELDEIAELREEMKAEFKENSDKLSEEFETAFEEMPEIMYTTYTNAKGDIIGISIEVGGEADTRIDFYSLEKSNKSAIMISAKSTGYEVFELVAEGKTSGDSYTGIVELSVAGQDIAELEIEDFDIKNFTKGKFTLSPSKLAAQALAGYNEGFEQLGIDLGNISLVLEFDENSFFELALKSEGKTVFGINGKSEECESQTIKLPENTVLIDNEYYAEDMLESWAGTINAVDFVQNLPKKVQDLLVSIVSGMY